MAGALDGIRVVDLTTMISGPIATMMLADQGADVIKIEPKTGDLVRRLGPSRGDRTATFLAANRNKRSLVLDLKSDAGLEALKKLVAPQISWCRTFDPAPPSGWELVKMPCARFGLISSTSPFPALEKPVPMRESGSTIRSFRLCPALPPSRQTGTRGVPA